AGLYLLFGMALFAAFAVQGKRRGEIDGQWWFCVLLLVTAVFVHYLVASVGFQSFYYMKPTLIVAWMCGIVLCAQLRTIRFPTLGLISIAIVILILARPVISQYLFFVSVFPKALQYVKDVNLAETESPVYSESQFFSFRSRIPVVDMGDTVSQVEKTGY